MEAVEELEKLRATTGTEQFRFRAEAVRDEKALVIGATHR